MSNIKSRNDFNDTQIRSFINFAFHDYIASRTLLNEGLASQGTILAVTAFEKLLKGICLLYNIEININSHKLTSMIDNLKLKDASFLTMQDELFLKFIEKSYCLRYPDNLSKVFKINLPSLKILENLDRLFCKLIESKKVIEFNPFEKIYDVYKNNNNFLLKNKNVHFFPELKNKLAEEKQEYAKYKSDGTQLIEFFCYSDNIKYNDDWE